MGGNAAIDALARDQLGLVTRAQARAAGLSSSAIDRRLKSGALEVVAPRVYRVRGGAPASPHQRLLAICLSLGPGSVASHGTAAWLWGLDRYDREPKVLEVTTTFGRHVGFEGVRVHQRRGVLDEGYTHRSHVPVTVLTRTMLDLAGVLPNADLEVVLDSAARFRPGFFVELDELLGAVKARGRAGIQRLYELLKLRRQGPPTGSGHETKVFQALRRAGIELPVLQHDIHLPNGRFLCRPDFVWPRKQIALFVDSGYHVGKRARTDATQRLELIKLGWRPVVVMRDMLDKGAWISEFAPLFWPVWPTIP